MGQRHGGPLRLFDATSLAAVPVPNPSEAVAEAMGTASVAEAAALRAAGAWPAFAPPAPFLLPHR